jgi:hypothetical protein
MEFAIKTTLQQGLTPLLPETIIAQDHIAQVQTAAQDQVALVAAEDQPAAAEEAEEDNPIRFTYTVLN